MKDALTRLASALADRYRVERELGHGGMATVYLAHDLKHDRKVAIKVLKPALAEAMGVERFLREIKTIANLQHPHILPLFDSGEVMVEGRGSRGSGATLDPRPLTALYYVMPFVEGETLRARIDRESQLPIGDVTRIAAQVAGALHYAHRHGVVHRDIKPDNILLLEGEALLADFGIALAMTEADRGRLTGQGMSLGTPQYMSPEQAAGDREVDPRTDIYSLGAVTYEMLTGEASVTGPNARAIIAKVMTIQPTAPRVLRESTPPALEEAVMRALAKAPVDRFETAREFAEALTGHALTPTPAAPLPRLIPSTVPSSRLFRRPWLLATVAVVAVAVALLLWRRAAGTDVASSVAVLPFVDLSPDKTNAYLGDGISETLINALANVPGLSVAARTSAFSFRDKAGDVREIGRQLGVATVLEGSVQRAGDYLRVTAQLIKTADGLHLWSESFDRGASDIFAVQDEVAKAVVNALQLRLVTTSDSTSTLGGTRSPEAYDAYLLGRYHWNRRTTEGMIDATVAFKRALALDSNYAQAWSGLADTYVLSIPEEYDVPGINRDSTLQRAEVAARRAIALEPRLGEAYASLGEIVEYHGKRAEARDAFRRAIALAPKYATGHQWYSYFLAAGNQWDDAIREMEIAHRLDPLSHVITLSLAIFYDGADRFADATPLYEQGLAQSPEAYYAWSGMVGHELALGNIDAAVTALDKSHGWPHMDTSSTRIVRGLRDPAARAATIDALARAPDPELAIPFFRWLRGDEATLQMLEAAAASGHRTNGTLGMYVFLGPKLRIDPRLLAILPRMGLPAQDSDARQP